MFWIITFGAVIIAVLFRVFTKPQQRPIFGIYSKNPKFFSVKFLFLYAILQIRKFSSKREFVKSDVFKFSKSDLACDGPQPLYDTPLAVDGVYFNGASDDGKAIVCGLARRPKKITNTFFIFWINSEELLLMPNLPDSTIEQTDEEENMHSAGGLKISVVEPLKIWNLQYKGPMRYAHDLSKIVHVDMDATWKTKFNVFNFDEDMSNSSKAIGIAREKWSREYFNNFKSFQQTHFEQFGTLTGKIVVDDQTHFFKINSLRDHTIGKKRDWKLIHRYALHFINLSNGDCISLGKICVPTLFSDMTLGFICINKTKEIHPIEKCNLKLYQHGENGKPPTDYAYEFIAGGMHYVVQVKIKASYQLHVGQERESIIYERVADFLVNGIKGMGITEWQYNNIDNIDLRKI